MQVREINSPKCKKAHKIEDYGSFKELGIRERLETLKKAGACFFCLSPGHLTRDCGKAKKYKIRGCTRYHHTLLHENQEANILINRKLVTDVTVALEAVRAQIRNSDGGEHAVKILLDEGSDITLARVDLFGDLR